MTHTIPPCVHYIDPREGEKLRSLSLSLVLFLSLCEPSSTLLSKMRLLHNSILLCFTSVLWTRGPMFNPFLFYTLPPRGAVRPARDKRRASACDNDEPAFARAISELLIWENIVRRERERFMRTDASRCAALSRDSS